MKCAICKKNIETTFLEKPIGTYIKNEKGKKLVVCHECQSRLKTKEEILKNL